MHQLGLAGMARAFAERQANPQSADLSHAEWLGLLLDRKATERYQKRLRARLRYARRRHQAAVEDVDYRAARGLDRSLFQSMIAGHTNGLLSLSLCLVRNRRRCWAGAEGRYVDQPRHAMAMCRQRNSAGAFDVNGAIGLSSCLGQNADQIDDRIGPRDCSIYSDIVKQISLDDLHCLGRCGRDLNTAGLAYGQAHRLATSDKERHEMAADE